MILHPYDEDTRDLHWGKYDNPMAKYIAERVASEGDYGDDEIQTGEMEGGCRYGRRIYSWDNRGFVYCDTYATVADAEAHMAKVRDAIRCEECGASWGDDEHECGEDDAS